jgi:hypothetical protein
MASLLSLLIKTANPDRRPRLADALPAHAMAVEVAMLDLDRPLLDFRRQGSRPSRT